MGGQFDTVARIGLRQHGRVARRQLLGADVDPKRIDRWVRDGLLRIVHRGVYAIGHTAPSLHAVYMAAVLAGGDRAVLSHRAAGCLLKLLRGLPPRPEITVPSTASARYILATCASSMASRSPSCRGRCSISRRRWRRPI